MTDAFDAIAGKLKELGVSWASYSALGSFALYVVGYLALRFHLTALGVGTDLAVLDERYLFTGAKFLVYFLSSIPIVLLAALPIALVVWLLARLIPASLRARLASPALLALAGIVISILMIQLVMRQCFEFSNLLLADTQPASWQWRVMLSREDAARTFFSARWLRASSSRAFCCWPREAARNKARGRVFSWACWPCWSRSSSCCCPSITA